MKDDFEILCGDCFYYIPQLIDCGFKFDLIVTDPPYDIKMTRGNGKSKNHYENELCKSMNELIDLNINSSYDIRKFADYVVKLQSKINAYFFCNKKQIPEYLDVYVNHLKCNFEILSWHKTNAMPTYFNKYLTDTEFVLYFNKQSGKLKPANYEDAKTYYLDLINAADKKKYNHPTIKPLPFVERMIKNSSSEGDLIFDPFSGSGTTGVAALKNKRKFLGIELLPKYYKLSKKRCENLLM